MKKYVVACAEDIPPGARKIVDINGREIGILNVEGSYYAFQNRCPHQGAPICLGPVEGTNLSSDPKTYRWGRENEILRCPWHGWEFDLHTGKALVDPTIRLHSVSIGVEESEIIVYL